MVTKSKDKKAVEEICAGLPPANDSDKKKKAVKNIVKSLPKIAKKETPAHIVISRPPLPKWTEIKIVKVAYRFNIIGIFRKLNSIGKGFKIIGKGEKEKEIYQQILSWFKKPVKPVIEPPVKIIPDITKTNKNYEDYLEVLYEDK